MVSSCKINVKKGQSKKKDTKNFLFSFYHKKIKKNTVDSTFKLFTKNDRKIAHSMISQKAKVRILQTDLEEVSSNIKYSRIYQL